jgi:hypothetical protein
MPRISKRLEALERAADKEIFGDGFPVAMAIAYYLGGAKDERDWDAYGRALGYQDPDEFWQALANQALANLAGRVDKSSDFQARVRRTESKLLVRFGYHLRRVRPAALRDAPYRIVSTLPEKWRALIKRAYRASYESEARGNRMMKELMERARKRRS